MAALSSCASHRNDDYAYSGKQPRNVNYSARQRAYSQQAYQQSYQQPYRQAYQPQQGGYAQQNYYGALSSGPSHLTTATTSNLWRATTVRVAIDIKAPQ